MKNNLFEYLKSINEECSCIEQQTDGNYHIMYKKRMIHDDGSDAGWLYTDIPNVRLNDDDIYVVEPIEENKIGNREYRRSKKNGKSN